MIQEIELNTLIEGKEDEKTQVPRENYLNHQTELLPDYNEQQDKPLSDSKWQENQEVKFIEHTVTPMDTLTGLSIQYGVATRKIKNFNELDGDDIYFLKTIKIPNPKTNYSLNYNQEDYEKALKQQKIDFFKRNVMQPEDSSDKVARYYLEQGEWDEKKAAKDYQDDLDWELKQKEMEKKGFKGESLSQFQNRNKEYIVSQDKKVQ